MHTERIPFLCLLAVSFLGGCLEPQTNDPVARMGGDEYDAHVASLEKRLAGRGFSIVIEKPFVVIGDESPARVQERASRTVKWAVDLLRKAYFTKDPTHIIDVWLFKGEESYRRHAKEFFGAEPDTPFGYYSSRHRALVMDISTGGGTLVHEIVHPFVAANFPACPAWFNEGLGSLYEQSGERDGQIVGYPNWRLRGLQKAVKNNEVPSFEHLCKTSTYEFYERDRGTNYAQARYLLYYLQEKGLLHRYYHAFLEARRDDPTGYTTLRKVLGDPDMEAFKLQWELFVLGLLHR